MRFWPFKSREKFPALTLSELHSQLIHYGLHARPRELYEFCNRYLDQIEDNVATLRKVPEEFHEDIINSDLYLNALVRVATTLREQCKSPILWDTITQRDECNPIERWDQFRSQIPARSEKMEHPELINEIGDLINEVKKCKGSGATHYVALLHGDRGRLLFESGAIAEAEKEYLSTLELSLQIDEPNGINFALGCLIELSRYQLEDANVNRYSEQLIQFLEKHQQYHDAAEIKKNIGFSDIEPPPEILVKLTKRSRQILQFLWDGQITSIDALVRHVYFDKACTPDAIRKAINRLNDSLVEHTSGKLEVKTQDKNVWLARIE